MKEAGGSVWKEGCRGHLAGVGKERKKGADVERKEVGGRFGEGRKQEAIVGEDGRRGQVWRRKEAGGRCGEGRKQGAGV